MISSSTHFVTSLHFRILWLAWRPMYRRIQARKPLRDETNLFDLTELRCAPGSGGAKESVFLTERQDAVLRLRLISGKLISGNMEWQRTATESAPGNCRSPAGSTRVC